MVRSQEKRSKESERTGVDLRSDEEGINGGMKEKVRGKIKERKGRENLSSSSWWGGRGTRDEGEKRSEEKTRNREWGAWRRFKRINYAFNLFYILNLWSEILTLLCCERMREVRKKRGAKIDQEEIKESCFCKIRMFFYAVPNLFE